MKKCKVLLLVLLVLSMCLIAMACRIGKEKVDFLTGNQANRKNQSMDRYAKLDNPDISLLNRSPDAELFNASVKLYEEKYNAKVDLKLGNIDEMFPVLMAAGAPPDMIQMQDQMSLPYMVRGALQPAEKYFDMNDPMWNRKNRLEVCKWNGAYYGVPSGPYSRKIIFNKTMFENNGLKTPLEYYKEGMWTWDTFREVAMKLTKDTNGDGAVDRWGFASQVEVGYSFIQSNGGDFFKYNDDGTIELTLKDQKVQDALRFYQESFFNDKYIKNQPYKKCMTDFNEGIIAMTDVLINVYLPTYSKEIKYDWDFAPFPVPAAGREDRQPGECLVIGIPQNAKNPMGGAAFTYIWTAHGEERGTGIFSEYINEEQIKNIEQWNENIVLSRYKGVGNMNKEQTPLWFDLIKGTPVSTVIEKYEPVFKAQIELLQSEQK